MEKNAKKVLVWLHGKRIGNFWKRRISVEMNAAENGKIKVKKNNGIRRKFRKKKENRKVACKVNKGKYFSHVNVRQRKSNHFVENDSAIALRKDNSKYKSIIL